LTYAAWAPGEPNDFDFGEDAVWMYADGEWNDIHGAPRTTPDGERIAMLAKPTVAIAGVVLGRAALGAARRATSRALRRVCTKASRSIAQDGMERRARTLQLFGS